MSKTATPVTAHTVPGQRPEPRYTVIERAIDAAITAGALPRGTVLTEGPIARLFGTSRTPVRTALNELTRRGVLAPFSGRGVVVPGADGPRRIAITHDMLGLSADAAAEPPPGAAQRIAADFEDAVARALPFGMWRINEQAAADHYDVSRTVVREALSRFQDRGLVRKDLRSHWIVGPLTARDIAHHFAIRAKLEPLALTDAGPRTPRMDIEAMTGRALDAVSQGSDMDPGRIDALETDVHITLLSRSPNPHLLRMIHQSQTALVVNRVFAATVGVRPFEIALREHLIVFEFIMRGAWEAASRALEEHLNLSAERTRQRLKAISVFPVPSLPPYLIRQDL